MNNLNTHAFTRDDKRIAQMIEMRDNGMTQEEIAKAIGASQSSVSRILATVDAGKQPKPNPVLAFAEIGRKAKAGDFGPCDDEHLEEFCERRAAAIAAWRREFFPS